MSTPDDRPRSGTAPAAPVSVDLRGLYDDPAAPAELTVFPTDPGRDVTTEWLTVDVVHVVRLREMC